MEIDVLLRIHGETETKIFLAASQMVENLIYSTVLCGG